MPEATPPVKIAKPGTIPISAVNNANKQGERESAPRAPAAKLKTVIRRLAPGLTRAEFESALGEEWLPGKGKVDWMQYKAGKIAKDAAKPSRPSRCYLHLTAQAHLAILAQHVQSITFNDSKSTTMDPCLAGPPVLDYAMYQRVPTGKKRNDARQGLIDQDSEFIEFLESLTNPITRPQNVDALLKDEPAEVITTTPLIQHLREKKAAKEKAKENKSKKHDRQTSKSEAGDAKEASTAKTSAASKDEKKSSRRGAGAGGAKDKKTDKERDKDAPAKGSSPQKEKAKPVTQVAKNNKPAAGSTESPAPPASRAGAAKDGAAKDAQSGSAGGGNAGNQRKGGRNNKKDNDSAAASSQSKPPAAPLVTPMVLKRQPPPPSAAPLAAPTAKAATLSNPNGTQAFVKHANASQGVTEALILSSLSVFGPIKSVEIDKRKGFAYVDFQDSTSLAKAVGQGTIKVAQSNVLVLERKERKDKADSKPADPSPPASTAAPAGKGASNSSSSNANAANASNANTGQKSENHNRNSNRGRGGRGGRGGGGGRGGRGGSNAKDGGGGGGGGAGAQPPQAVASAPAKEGG